MWVNYFIVRLCFAHPREKTEIFRLWTFTFFMKEGVDGEARRGNCEKLGASGIVVIIEPPPSLRDHPPHRGGIHTPARGAR